MTRQNDPTDLQNDSRNAQQGNSTGDGGGQKDMASWKPGSEAREAKNVTSPGDFGVPAGGGPTREPE
jgi:hypothetical protein